jgi:CRISPR-associated endonuclease Csy4
MNVYLDITLLPGADISLHFLWEKVYRQIHLGLADVKISNGSSPIGIAFPEYNVDEFQLGTKLRLFALDQATLESFNARKWLNSLADYIHLTSIRNVPSNVTGYVRYKRQQSKSNIERLARRKAKHEKIELEHALELLKDRKEIFVKAPFIKISSISSRQNFRIFIIKESISEQIKDGFSCYGLSTTSTLPDF